MKFDAFFYIDILGTLAFALSGVTAAVERKFDFFGAIILAFVTAVGGGTLRDVLIGSTPVGWMKSDIHIWVILLAIPMAFFFISFLRKLRKTLFIFDTVGIGLFTILGIEKALAVGLSPLVAGMMGVVSAVFGGIIRDVLVNEVPLIFRKEVYAFACIAGAAFYLFTEKMLPQYAEINSMIAIAIVILIRILAIRKKWSIPFNPLFVDKN